MEESIEFLNGSSTKKIIISQGSGPQPQKNQVVKSTYIVFINIINQNSFIFNLFG